MKVYDLFDNQGRIFAFEVSSAIGRMNVCSVVKQIPRAKIINAPRWFLYSGSDVFCEFEIDGQQFQIWEPYGDSNRYWIGTEPPQYCKQLDVIRTAFLQYSFWRNLWQKIIGFGGD